MTKPTHPKLYHIVHLDRLPSILADVGLLCDALVMQQNKAGSMIGMGKIKQPRRSCYACCVTRLKLQH